MRTALVLLLAFAAAAVSGSRDVDGDFNSGKHSIHLQEEMILEGIAPPLSRRRLDRNAAASSGADSTFDGAADGSAAESWSRMKTFEALAAAGTNSSVAGSNGTIPRKNDAIPGTTSSIAATNRTISGTKLIGETNGTAADKNSSIDGTSGTIVGTNGSVAGTNGAMPRVNGSIAGRNVTLPPNLFSPWSLTEILNGIALAIESERKLRRAAAGAIPSPPSRKGSSLPWADGLAAGCASLVLNMAPCVMDIAESTLDSGLQKPSDLCCSAVLAVSTPSAAGGAACACYLLRGPSMLDLQLEADRVDALFSACDGRHFTNGSFAKLCNETKTLPPLVMFLAPTSANITDSIHVPPAPAAPATAQPGTNGSREAPTTSGVAESMVAGGAGGRWTLLVLSFMWCVYLMM